MKKVRDYSEKNLREWEDYEGQEYDWDNQEADTENLYAGEEEMEFDGVEEEEVYYENEEYDGEEATDYYGEKPDSYAASGYYEGEDYYGFEEGVEEYNDPSGMDASLEYGYEAEEDYEEMADYEDAEYAAESGAKGDSRQRRGYSQPEEGFFEKIGRMLHSMDTMDRIMVGTGVGVLILALITVSVFFGVRTVERQVSDFAQVGIQLKGIETIGERGLLAVADAEMARLAAASLIDLDEPLGGYDETGYEREVTVELNFTSIQKDLKVKFVNKRTGKLVPNVPFSVSVTDPDNKTSIWSDDDMDGIIYKTDIKPGTYKVTMEELTDSRYKDYIISTTTQTTEVKKDIDYKKVDVANEVKTESEINAAKEDTKKNETTVESALQDTVTWVASTRIPASYNEVAKNTIPDPMTVALSKSFMRMNGDENLGDEETGSGNNGGSTLENIIVTVGDGETNKSGTAGGEPITVSASVSVDNTAEHPITYSATTTDESVATASFNGNTISIKCVGEGSAVITATANYTEAPEKGGSVSINVTVTEPPTPPAPSLTKGTVSVEPTTLTLAVGTTLSAKATASEFTSGQKLNYNIVSSQPSIASASITGDGSITVKGEGVGDATLTITVDYESKPGDDKTPTEAVATINVKVTGKKTLTLDKNTMTVYTQVPAVIKAVLANAGDNPAIKASSSDTNVATVSVNKQEVTVTGVKAGSAIITVEYTDGGETLKATCTVTVKINPKEDKSNKLKDNAGRQVYVLENGTYREAVIADYYTASKFFLAGEAKYTGWQTLDGKVYFFKEDGTKVTGEQVIQGAKYTFAGDGSMVVGNNGIVGIDVSKWNGTIDWNAVKNSGISYVIIRCGYRGSAEGTLVVDPKYEANIKGAAAAGLKVGVYFFSQAINEVEAVEEASMVLDLIKNYKLSYPIFLDVEASGGRADTIDKSTRTAVCKAFCQTIQNSGYTAGVYANKSWFETKIDADSLSSYKIWLAQYASNPTYKGRYNIWQYRSTGRVDGISGSVDMNISYLGY